MTASGVVLDCASLIASSIDLRAPLASGLMIRSGFVALRSIADFFRLSYDPDPLPTDPLSITREEYEAVLDQIAALGVPLKADRDQAWRDFAGWRVNYDYVLRRMAEITYAPYAMWISDHRLNPDCTPKAPMHVLVDAVALATAPARAEGVAGD